MKTDLYYAIVELEMQLSDKQFAMQAALEQANKTGGNAFKNTPLKEYQRLFGEVNRLTAEIKSKQRHLSLQLNQTRKNHDLLNDRRNL